MYDIIIVKDPILYSREPSLCYLFIKKARYHKVCRKIVCVCLTVCGKAASVRTARLVCDWELNSGKEAETGQLHYFTATKQEVKVRKI